MFRKRKLRRLQKAFKKAHRGKYVRVSDVDQFDVVSYGLGHEWIDAYEIFLKDQLHNKKKVLVAINATNAITDEQNKRMGKHRVKAVTYKKFIESFPII